MRDCVRQWTLFHILSIISYLRPPHLYPDKVIKSPTLGFFFERNLFHSRGVEKIDDRMKGGIEMNGILKRAEKIALCFLLLSSLFLIASQAQTRDKFKERSFREGAKALRAGDYKKAVAVYKEILARDPQETQAHLQIALAYLKTQNYRDCYDHALRASRIDATNAHAHALAGAALLRSGLIVSATNELVEAFRLNSKEPLAFGAAAEIDYYEGRTKESRAKAFQAHLLDPDEPDYLVTIARAASRLEYFAEAAEAYEKFLDIAPITDSERRERVRGLIRFYRRLAGIKIYQVGGQPSGSAPFRLGLDRRPYVKVLINGREANFVIDTGSYSTVVSRKAVKRLGVSEIARGGNSEGFGGTGKFPIVYGLIKSVQIDGVKVQAVPCFIREFHVTEDQPAEDREDGLIGLAVLSSFLTQLDYGASVLRLDPREDPAVPLSLPADVRVIPFRTTQNGLISVETEIDSAHRINAILDSAAGSIVVSSSAVERFNLADRKIKGQRKRVIGAAGIADNVELLRVANCRVADLQLENMRALILDFGAINETSGFEQSGILGGDFLKNYRVTIDFARSQIRLQPHTSAEKKNGQTQNQHLISR
jgi:tetratricopeptide (TPR) repeat protein